jgi:hypothetical protein
VTEPRTAHPADTKAVVGVFPSARAAALADLPILHTDAEDRALGSVDQQVHGLGTRVS